MLRAQVQEVVQRIHVADDSLTSSDSASDGIYGIIEKCVIKNYLLVHVHGLLLGSIVVST